MNGKITSDQETSLRNLFLEVLKTWNLSKDEVQVLIRIGDTVQKFTHILKYLAVLDHLFGKAEKDFEFTVPRNYDHNTQIDTFAKKTKELKSTRSFASDLTSANFAKATNKLVPGKKYRVQIFPTLAMVNDESCMIFLKLQGAILVGAQGMTLLQEWEPEQFPVENWLMSFDEKDALWKDSRGNNMVPGGYRESDDGWRFGLGPVKEGVNNCNLLCFSEL